MKLLFLGVFLLISGAVQAEERVWLSAKGDYIPCDVQPCVTIEGSIWSEKNPNGVAVSVAMGVKPAATDDQIKTVLTEDLRHYGVSNIKFFFEQNDARSSIIALHVRGGTEGLFHIGNVRDEIPLIAKRALNTNPLFRTD